MESRKVAVIIFCLIAGVFVHAALGYKAGKALAKLEAKSAGTVEQKDTRQCP